MQEFKVKVPFNSLDVNDTEQNGVVEERTYRLVILNRSNSTSPSPLSVLTTFRENTDRVGGSDLTTLCSDRSWGGAC